MPNGPLENLIARVKKHPVAAALGVLFSPLGAVLKRLVAATDWISRFDTWRLHRPSVPPWSGEFLRLLTPNLALAGYVLSVGCLALLFFAGTRRTTPILARPNARTVNALGTPSSVDPIVPRGTARRADEQVGVPDIVAVDARTRWVVEQNDGYAEWDNLNLQKPESFGGALRALIASFRNNSRFAAEVVRAEIAYLGNSGDIVERVAFGTWLAEEFNWTTLSARDTRDLVIALYDERTMFAVNDNRRDSEQRRSCTPRPLPYTQLIVCVTLVILDGDFRAVGEREERFRIELTNSGPKITLLRPPGSVV
jgi:hypothetical protein